jgi:threonine/homoserine/homoserine lactone efflux protein
MNFFLKGLVLGFSIAAPVGPIGLLCIRRTLAEGRASGFISGLGAATADGFYGFIAAFGLTAISGFLLDFRLPIRYIGALFLLYIALKTFFTKPTNKDNQEKTKVSLIKSYTSTVGLTLTNPTTIISFIAVFAGLGVGTMSQNYTGATFTVIGVFCGSVVWWLLLSTSVGLFHHKISDTGMVWINRIAGILMISLGIFSILK